MFRQSVFLIAIVCAAQDAAIHMDGGVFRVKGWHAVAEPAGGWSSLFAVYAGSGDVPPVLGTYSVEEGDLVFRPRFPLTAGMHVRAVLHTAGGGMIESVFDLPKAAPLTATTRVAHVYPTTGVLPANQLKFYLYFSAPMRKGEAWQHIHLVREDGSRVELPFLELDQELWDRDNQRLTVLFDPGRIKRGLASLAEAGPAIEEGMRYTLIIDREWPDGRGAPLAEEFRKPFRVSAADRTPPEAAQWRVTAPRTGTIEPLVLVFPKPMDYALLQHSIEIAGASGPVAGSVAVEREETAWRFTPQQPWKTGDYRIVVQTTLEDLAGNHIGRAFDVDTFDPITRTVTHETIAVPFRIRK